MCFLTDKWNKFIRLLCSGSLLVFAWGILCDKLVMLLVFIGCSLYIKNIIAIFLLTVSLLNFLLFYIVLLSFISFFIFHLILLFLILFNFNMIIIFMIIIFLLLYYLFSCFDLHLFLFVNNLRLFL